jgi:hypothetical protein
MVQLLEAAAASALFRTESRGVHYREDFPDTDNDGWLYESIVPPGGFDVHKREITVTDLAPPSGDRPYLETLKTMMLAHSDVGGHH